MFTNCLNGRGVRGERDNFPTSVRYFFYGIPYNFSEFWIYLEIFPISIILSSIFIALGEASMKQKKLANVPHRTIDSNFTHFL